MDTTQTIDGTLTSQSVASKPTPLLLVAHSPDADAIGEFVPIMGAARKLGRKDTCELCVDDPRVSREHAVIVGREIRSISKKGIRVNCRPVERSALSPGDVVRIGGTVLVVTAGAHDLSNEWDIVGGSEALARLRQRIGQFGPSSLPIVITGEPGAGKERVAHALHLASGRTGELVALNCAAIPADLAESELFGHKKGAFTGAVSDRRGAFERANRGTLFLDELGELSLPAQAKLLRTLEDNRIRPVGGTAEKLVDVRVIAATNADLDAAVATGSFRQDLLGRLRAMHLPLLPLRERREDIMPLLTRFMGGVEPLPIRATLVETLLQAHWPNNARDIRNAAEQFKVLLLAAKEIQPTDYTPPPAPAIPSLPTPTPTRPRRPPTREELVAALRAHGGNVTHTAKYFGVARKTVHAWKNKQEPP